MFFRPLSLAIPIALAVANPLVGHSKFTALQTALMGTNSTIYAIYQDLNDCAINVDSAHAMAVYNNTATLDRQIIDVGKVVPEHVMSDVDGKWLCDVCTRGTPMILEIMDKFIARKDDFQRVNLVGDVGSLLRKYFTDGIPVGQKLLHVTSASSRMCVADNNNDSAGDIESRVHIL
ncbi:hypothetical protein ARMSODRAFT_1021117 [Armillaria solidipes]|uniref:Uncharacterized protein n=1 Tax=Armillaria solidipes TaxID=1076256 RepID=A0A2H3BS32_9AGAR|nr:hypothetical protein ARMSODRAFT_1021117 [Armillaria solidipes]